jgi:hypothetical protein
MKSIARASLSGLGLIILAAAPSFAVVLPIVNIGSDGSISVSTMSFAFSQNDTNNTPPASAEVAAGTTLTYTGDTLQPGQPININDGAPVTFSSVSLPGFLTFPDQPGLSVTLDSFGAASSNSDCPGLAVASSCSPSLVGGFLSPIILTATSTGTGALLSCKGTEMDNGTAVGTVAGNFSATVTGETPEDVATSPFTLTSYSGTLVVTPMSAVPEPRDLVLVALAGLLVGLVVKRKKNEA